MICNIFLRKLKEESGLSKKENAGATTPKGQISESELTIMQAVWQAARAVSVQDVHDLLGETESWKYNTVATFMVRLVDKGYLAVSHQEGRGRSRLFMPLVSETDYLKDHLQQTLQKQFRGSSKAFFAAFMAQEDLDQEEIDELRQWLDEL
jgi:predicted transcriptional regulator